MKRYIVRTGTGDAFNAASKARQDAEAIALQLGFEAFEFRGNRTANGSFLEALHLVRNGLLNWGSLIRTAVQGSQILIQYPHYPVKSAVLMKRAVCFGRRRKNLQFIALVHDLDSLRGLHGKGAEYSDAEVLPQFDRIICHNDRMRSYLIQQGIPAEKLTVLNIFDYLTEASPKPHQLSDGITVAGNLSTEKSGYLLELLKINLPVHLYGKGLEAADLPPNVSWHGSFPPDQLPGVVTGAFGLVWDGPSGTTCDGPSGQYLQYNNPHKLSLYFASGMPVIIWEQAAEAKFVHRHRAGLTVSCLSEIEEAVGSLSEEEYRQMAANAGAVGVDLRRGKYLTAALKDDSP